MRIERNEWADEEFVEIHDPDMEDNPAAVLPAEDAREIAIGILGPEIQELVKEWRATAHETRHKTVRQGKVLHHLADELEKVLEG